MTAPRTCSRPLCQRNLKPYESGPLCTLCQDKSDDMRDGFLERENLPYDPEDDEIPGEAERN